MRLHSLTVQAFGPFGGTEAVDFDALGAGGLFLIHGPTGAGKTSVLDAVCFALYGQVPGVRESARSPRSNHAPPGREPRVTLETTIRGRRLRFSRSPQWERPKKRGSGTTTEKSRIVVTELVDGDWRGLTNRLDEAGQLVGDLLRLSLAQFCQIVLLPQGEFARFLRSGAQERRESLQRLFETGVFADVESWLAEHARSLGRAAGEAEAAVGRVADLVAEFGGAPRPDEDSTDLDALVPWAAELAGVTTATARDAAEVAAATAAERDRARAAVERARETAERQHRHAEAARRAAALGERAAERAAIDAELTAAERAATVLPLLYAVEHRRRQLEKAELAASERRALVGRLADVPDIPAASPGSADAATQAVLDALGAAERDRRDEVARLAHLRDDAERLRALRGEAAAVAARIEAAEGDLAETRRLLAALPGQRTAVADELAAARERAGARDAAVGALELAQGRLAAARACVQLRGQAAAAEQARTRATDEAQLALDELLTVRRQRVEGMAAELAASLAAGAECPVCGAVEHPRPATGGTRPPSAEEEEAAQRVCDAAQERRSRAEAALAALTERLAAAEAAAGELTVPQAEALVRGREEALAEIDTAAAAARRLADRLAELDGTVEHTRAREARLVHEAAELGERRQARKEEAARIAERLDAARGDDPDIAARAARLGAEADLLASAAAALRQRDAAVEELRAAESEAARARTEAGFGTDEAVRDAERTETQRRSLRERARGYDDELAAARAALADPDLAAASRQPAPDVDGARTGLRAAEDAAEWAAAWRDRLAGRAERLTALRAELAARLADSRPARQRHAVADGLARLAAGTSGDNRENVRLSSYVLAARLEQVVAAANDRLAVMSGGRYELRHTVDKAAGDRTRSGGGLGLRVLDSWTGQERDPATLSGGETFVGSLALALGLADVAGQEAGGTDIGTLFVDEGFGTLDEETLDEVLGVLDDLRDGGRAVGVVSHVADLRTRISTRLKVIKTNSGSRLEQTG
ncbi:AAA family ATPase [Marinitenerispora sediminis]|uniref:Nuclease SbcCD subunit C n=1 Tax=Marinitenerispora sediminis TaxID=1931232 RepID=A0A368SYK3_9ACTN|nr:SMC family ATPase [Marinitenerispora sediminis]RCV47642.1 SMC family ATPase [Marinitenerispora sediminis]RCV48054.1 SMC family ATPase [Marinitenerispora sediminis]RCV49471.1 SMC family ATPase [Marinitenerispora sediminis]